MMVLRIAAFVVSAAFVASPALAGDAFLGIEKPAKASRASWAKLDGLDVAWERANVAKEEDGGKNEILAFSIALSPVSAYLADSHRTERPIPALYLRLSEDDGATRFYKFSDIVVPAYERAPADKPQVMEAATILVRRIERVSP